MLDSAQKSLITAPIFTRVNENIFYFSTSLVKRLTFEELICGPSAKAKVSILIKKLPGKLQGSNDTVHFRVQTWSRTVADNVPTKTLRLPGEVLQSSASSISKSVSFPKAFSDPAGQC